MTRNSYQHRPPSIRLTNFVGRAAGLARRLSLNPDKLMATARRRTRLSDFGAAGWHDGFGELCASLEDEARLNLAGRLAARAHLLQLLRNRLQIQAARSEPVSAQAVTAPVFITGLPRSGSTLLHGLLAQDPAIRVPWTWEVMFPCPLPGRRRAHDLRRVHRTDTALRWLNRLAPRFKTVHPVGAGLPQECIAITAHEFASVEFHTTFNVPRYQSWLDAQDGLTALRYHRQFLQHLQFHGGAGRWFLKAPAHLCTLPAIATIYPDARFVFTHRDPVNVAASIASHGVILRCAFSDRVDVAAVADYWMNWWARAWLDAQQFKAGNAVLSLQYEDLVADPIAAVQALYARLDMDMSDEAEQNMRTFLSANPQDKHGHHRYTLDEFGLNPALVRANFGV